MPVRRRFRRSRERTEWIGLISVTPTVVAVNALQNNALLGPSTLEEWPGGRIDRLLGQIFFSPATAPAAASGYGIFFGLTMGEIGASGTTTYDPETELDHRWIYWNSCFPQIGGTGASDQNVARWMGYFRFDLDRRIRRRYDTDRQLTLEVKNSNSSAASIQFSYAFRVLIAAGRK